MAASLESQCFYEAVVKGDLDLVQRLSEHPNVDFNLTDGTGKGVLHHAAESGDVELVRFLLQLKGLDVNARTGIGITPFFRACERNLIDVARVLMSDPRVDVNACTGHLVTPLFEAVIHNHVLLVRHMLESGRYFSPWIVPKGCHATSFLEAAREKRQLFDRGTISPEIEELLREYHNPHFKVGKLFALMVLCSDNYLAPQKADSPQKRFFLLTARLPIELQMIISNIAFGLTRDVVSSFHAEPAFQKYTLVQKAPQ